MSLKREVCFVYVCLNLARRERKTAHFVGHGGIRLHDVHDAAVPGIRPAPQKFRRGNRDVLVDADGVNATARLRGIPCAIYVARV